MQAEQNMSRMATTVLLLLVLHSLVPALGVAQRQPPVALPECRDTCGVVSIPYPFGIGAGCYRDDGVPGFQLKCDDSGPSPPRLTTVKRGYRLANVSLPAGEATAYLNTTRTCLDSTGGFVGGSALGRGVFSIQYSPYLFSSTKNQLVALGCPNLGYFVDGYGFYVSGCMSVCRLSQYAMPGNCTGVGCCQSTIPSGLDYYEPKQYYNFSQGLEDTAEFVRNSTSCHYVFLVEKEWFANTDSVFLNRTDDFDVPVVLDWAIRNVGNCSAANGSTH